MIWQLQCAKEVLSIREFVYYKNWSRLLGKMVTYFSSNPGLVGTSAASAEVTASASVLAALNAAAWKPQEAARQAFLLFKKNTL